MRKGFLEVDISMYLVVIAVDRFSALLKNARTIILILLCDFGILPQQVDTVHDLESRSGRIKSLGHPVEQSSRLIVAQKVLPLHLDLIGIKIRFGDHSKYPAR